MALPLARTQRVSGGPRVKEKDNKAIFLRIFNYIQDNQAITLLAPPLALCLAIIFILFRYLFCVYFLLPRIIFINIAVDRPIVIMYDKYIIVAKGCIMTDYKQIADHWMEENKQLTDDNIKLKARVKYLEERVYAVREITKYSLDETMMKGFNQ